MNNPTEEHSTNNEDQSTTGEVQYHGSLSNMELKANFKILFPHCFKEYSSYFKPAAQAQTFEEGLLSQNHLCNQCSATEILIKSKKLHKAAEASYFIKGKKIHYLHITLFLQQWYK